MLANKSVLAKTGRGGDGGVVKKTWPTRPGLGTSANQVTFHSVRFRRTSGDATWVRGAWLAGR
jgi:hypothetical protein